MYTIGLTGGSGTGKSYVAGIFEKYGIKSINTDIIAAEVCKKETPCLYEIKDWFGGTVLNADGTLNRRLLGNIVFSDKQKLNKLNEITHKYILAECKEIIKEYAKSDCFAALVDAPLLFESKFNYLCDYIISVAADTEVRIMRITERDGITEEAALKRIENQHDNNFFINNSDYIIYNNPYNNVHLQIDLINQQLRWV